MTVKNGCFLPVVSEGTCKNDKGCHRCYDSCPGIGIDLQDCSEKSFSDFEIKENPYIGRYLQCYIGHTNDEILRESAASGGMVSQFLIWLLENRMIDGALVTGFDNNSPLKVRSYIARSKEDIINAKGSKYGPVSIHDGLKELMEADYGKFVIVGLPCHIHGIRKFLASNRKYGERIIGIFSLFCSGTQSFNYTEYILKQCGGSLKDLHYLSYREGHPSGMIAKGSSFEFFKDYNSYNRPLKSTFYPRRCLLCVDMFGELSDISFGDIHIKDKKITGVGISALIVRNRKWQTLLKDAQNDNAISLEEITENQMLENRTMASVKKSRNASFIDLLNLFHIATPRYGSSYNSKVNLKIAFRYCFMRFKQFIGKHKLLWFLLPKIK